MSQAKPEKMALLSLASSEREASVAVTVDGQIVSSIRFDDWLGQFPDEQQIGRSSALVSMVKDAMAKAAVNGTDLDAISLTNGPGRFTGLRVSVVTARLLGFAWNVPIVAVNSLEVAAKKLLDAQSLQPDSVIWALTDAQRRQVFAAQFTVQSNGLLEPTVPQGLFERDEILDQLRPADHVTGSGAFAFQDRIEEKIDASLPESMIAECDAVGVSKVANARVAEGRFDDPLKVEPIYFRPSAAEEVRLAKTQVNS